jgi:hypothetical protein
VKITKHFLCSTKTQNKVMSLTNTKDQLPFLGFLTPKRDQSDRLAPCIARRSVSSSNSCSDEQTGLDTSAILSGVEPGTPDSCLLDSRTPESGSIRWEGQPAAQRHPSERVGFETPARRLNPGRTFLQERMFGDIFESAEVLAATSSDGGDGGGLGDFLSPERDWGKRGRPRADEITSLIMEGSQSGSNIKCHICSR